MMHGWSGNILRVDLSTRDITREPTMKYARKYLGGRGINHAILFREVPAEMKAFDPGNLLIFGLGPLTGTFVPSPGRTQVTFKSPYPSGWGDTNMGGHWGPEVKYAGYDNIVITGKASKPVYLWIDNERVELRDAGHLWGKGRFEAEELIRQELGDEEIKIVSIGQAGEHQVWFANVMNDLTNSAGRTGAGAVMGSKKLKAIAVRGTRGISIADPKGLIKAGGNIFRKIKEHPLYFMLAEYGTASALDMIGAIGMIPIKNFRECGYWAKRDALYAARIKEKYEVRRSACFGCSAHCHCLYRIRDHKYAGIQGGGPEYETLAAFGTKCLCDDLAAILYMNSLCNNYGLDTVSTGNIIALLMELYEKGVITEKDTGGISMDWGDPEAMIAIINKVANRDGVGDRLAQDQIEYVRSLGQDPEQFVMHSKGLSPTGVEIRSAMGAALSFGVSPRGATHLSGLPTVEWVPNPELGRRISGYIEASDAMSYHPEAKARIVQYYEDLFILTDSLGICKLQFGHGILWHDSPEDLMQLQETLCLLLNTVTGDHFTWEDLTTIAHRVHTIERLYINSLGMTKRDDEPCTRSKNEVCEGEHPIGPTPLPAIDMKRYNSMLDAYYALRGWDTEGRPTRATCERLELADTSR